MPCVRGAGIYKDDRKKDKCETGCRKETQRHHCIDPGLSPMCLLRLPDHTGNKLTMQKLRELHFVTIIISMYDWCVLIDRNASHPNQNLT